MTGLEVPALVAAIPAGIALLMKAVLLGKEFTNGGGGFTSIDRNGLRSSLGDSAKDQALIMMALGELRGETKDQTKEIVGMRQDLRDLCHTFRDNMPRP